MLLHVWMVDLLVLALALTEIVLPESRHARGSFDHGNCYVRLRQTKNVIVRLNLRQLTG